VGGIGLAVLSLAQLIETLLEERPIEMSGLFLGLVGGSVVVAWKLLEVRDASRPARSRAPDAPGSGLVEPVVE
jgi:uncharacterized membrane protein